VPASPRPARPPAPFTAIVCVSRLNDGVWEHAFFEELESFDARDAWADAEDFELSEEYGSGLRPHVQGVVGPGGWVERPDWVNPSCCESPEDEQARWEAAQAA
jgi:hypothetical protein